MKPCFVFCHGFGFDAWFWDTLGPFFADHMCYILDLGYFGHPYLPLLHDPSLRWIGIGHSLGLIKLIQQPVTWAGLIGLNSFINFLGDEPAMRAIRQRELMYLKTHFKQAPIKTLQNFYKRCGAHSVAPFENTLDQTLLSADLDLLAGCYSLPSLPTLIIATEDDPVVPPALIHDNFSSYSTVSLDIWPQGGHSLGIHHASLVYDRVTRFYDTTYTG